MDRQLRVFLANPQKTPHLITVKKYLEFKLYIMGLSPHTVTRMLYNLRNLPLPEDFFSATPSIIKDYIEACWRRYSAETMRTKIGDIRQFCAWLKENELTHTDLAINIKRIKKRPRRQHKKKKLDQVDKNTLILINVLAKQLKKNNIIFKNIFGQPEINKTPNATQILMIRDLFILMFLYETGARVGELCKLGTKTINDAINAQQQVYLLTMFGKTEDRDRFFTQPTADIWRIWNSARPDKGKVTEEFAIISWRRGQTPLPAKTQTISDMIARKCDQYNLPNHRSYAIRGAKVHRSRQLVGIEMTQALLDHDKLESTQNYDEINWEEIEKAARNTGLQFDPW